MSLRFEQIQVGGFDKNFSYIIYCDDTHEAFVVDPAGEFELVVRKISTLRLEVVGILLTHTHADHIDALQSAIEEFQSPVFVHNAGACAVSVDAAQLITGGIEIELGNQVITVLHTPGHSEDSVCFSFTAVDNQPVLISGDTLFIDGCGRTNDHMITDLYDSIQSLKQLPSETVVLPGHNYGPVPSDTLAHQLRSNRFLLPVTFAGFCAERLGYTVDT